MKHTPKTSVVMGRALSEKRWDKSSETVIPPRGGTSEMVITTRRDGSVVIPLSRVGQGVPDDLNEVINDVLKVMRKRHTV